MKNKKKVILTILAIPVIYVLIVIGMNLFAQGKFYFKPDGINIYVKNNSESEIPALNFYLEGDEKKNLVTSSPLAEGEELDKNIKLTPEKDYTLWVSYEIDGKIHKGSLLYVNSNSPKNSVDMEIESINSNGNFIISINSLSGSTTKHSRSNIELTE